MRQHPRFSPRVMWSWTPSPHPYTSVWLTRPRHWPSRASSLLRTLTRDSLLQQQWQEQCSQVMQWWGRLLASQECVSCQRWQRSIKLFLLKRRVHRSRNIPWHHTIYSMHLDTSHHSVARKWTETLERSPTWTPRQVWLSVFSRPWALVGNHEGWVRYGGWQKICGMCRHMSFNLHPAWLLLCAPAFFLVLELEIWVALF